MMSPLTKGFQMCPNGKIIGTPITASRDIFIYRALATHSHALWVLSGFLMQNTAILSPVIYHYRSKYCPHTVLSSPGKRDFYRPSGCDPLYSDSHHVLGRRSSPLQGQHRRGGLFATKESQTCSLWHIYLQDAMASLSSISCHDIGGSHLSSKFLGYLRSLLGPAAVWVHTFYRWCGHHYTRCTSLCTMHHHYTQCTKDRAQRF